MGNNSWVAKITQNGKLVCAKVFDNERTAVAFIQRTTQAVADSCSMKMVYHRICITEDVCETYPRHLPVSTRKRDIVIIEAELMDKD